MPSTNMFQSIFGFMIGIHGGVPITYSTQVDSLKLRKPIDSPKLLGID